MSTMDILGTDLKLIDHENAGKDLTYIQSQRDKNDFVLVSSLDNFVQAINLRLNSKRGDLSSLGHPNYGSRLYTLIGKLNIPSNRKLLEVYTRECLLQEPRVKEILSINIESSGSAPGLVYIHAIVKPIKSQVPLNLVFPFNFEG